MSDLTIALVTYNRDEYLRKAIEAILAQNYSDFILMILDNHSTDKTKEVVASFSDNRIQYIRHDSNIGAVSNGNYAIDHCRTEFLMITHDDDIMGPNLIETQFNLIRNNPLINMVCSNIMTVKKIDENGNELPDSYFGGIKDLTFSRHEYIKHFARKGNMITAPTAIIRVSLLKTQGLRLNPLVGPEGDAFLWSEMNLYDGMIIVLAKSDYAYRVHRDQDSDINRYTMFIDLYNHYLVLLKKINNKKYLKAFEVALIKHVLVTSNYAFGRGPDESKSFRSFIDGILAKLELTAFQRFIVRAMKVSLAFDQYLYKFIKINRKLFLYFRNQWGWQ